MKTLILIALVALTSVVRAQDVVSKEEWNRQYNESWALTSQLFPDMNNTNSPIYREYKSILPPEAYPRLAHDSYLPLFHAIQAAHVLGITPHWTALSDAQKQEVFEEVTYYSSLLIGVIKAQNQQLAAANNSRPTGDTGFNPGAVEGPASAMFNPQPHQQSQQQSVHVEDSNGNSGQVIVTPQ